MQTKSNVVHNELANKLVYNQMVDGDSSFVKTGEFTKGHREDPTFVKAKKVSLRTQIGNRTLYGLEHKH